jgi:hypothetical protein
MGESDARFAAAKLLDRRFFEYPDLRGKTNAAGDYEVHCNKCGTVDTCSFSGKNDVDAQSVRSQRHGETSSWRIGRMPRQVRRCANGFDVTLGNLDLNISLRI